MRIERACLFAAALRILTLQTGAVWSRCLEEAILKVCQGGEVLIPKTDRGMEEGGLGDEPLEKRID